MVIKHKGHNQATANVSSQAIIIRWDYDLQFITRITTCGLEKTAPSRKHYTT